MQLRTMTALACTLATGLLTTGPASAQSNVQRVLRDVVQAASPAAPQSSQTDTGNAVITECAATVIHLTTAGLVFTCFDSGNIARYRFVVDEQRFPGRSELVIDLLENASQSRSGSGRATSARRLRVRHSDADPSIQAQTLCSYTQGMDGNPPCREAIDVAY